VVLLKARNQFSKPSTEMELIQWPRAARSTTREQDRRPASKIDVCVCVLTPFYRINKHGAVRPPVEGG
jgi:hypothetical protein